MLVILLIFKWLGWTNVNAVSYAVAVTVGWAVGKNIIRVIEKRRRIKRRKETKTADKTEE